MDPVSPISIPPAAPSPESKSKTWLWVLAGVSLLGTGIVAGVFLGKQLYSQNTAQIDSYDQCVIAKGSRIQQSYPGICVTAAGQRFVQPVSAPTTIPTEVADPTTNWKTYTFKPIGHTFKYPADWTAVQCEGGIHLFTQPTKRGGTSCEAPPFGVVFIAFNNKSIETGYLKSTDYILEKEQNITIPFGQATKRVIKQINEAPGPTNYIEITFKGTNGYYYLISTENLQYETVVDQILSTFKFTTN